ncbi:MAG: hypothetical protein K0M64_13175, partial [Rhizobium sp.]|nr:hypothetical protein [Rhizobium sp.]
MPRLRTEAPSTVAPVFSRALWQALALALLLVALPLLSFGQPLLGPAASFWLPALPALALLTLHRRFLGGGGGGGGGARGAQPTPPPPPP